ncbi:TPA: Sec63 [Trebouxia sp. C0004]
MELAILRLISVYIDQNKQFVLKPGSLKIVYLAPIRALVQEKVKQWQQTFGNKLGLTCSELTGDTVMADSLHLDNADIICTTPEKFDAVTRRHKDQGGMQFFSEVALVLIDEVHLLSENRGSALETGTISRVKMVSSMKEMSEVCLDSLLHSIIGMLTTWSAAQGHSHSLTDIAVQLPIAKVRFVAVSATIPNIQDIADWLQVPPAGLNAFGEEVRPVKLCTIVKGYAPTKTDFLFERRLNDYIYSVVSEHSKGKPSLVFCRWAGLNCNSLVVAAHSELAQGTVDTAMHLVSVVNKSGRGYIRDRDHHDKLQRLAATSSNKQLQQTLPAGIAFHNAGMDATERAQVEELFIARDVLVLCTTSTLAMGVNLPAHLVVLKGTRRWSSDGGETAGYQEYDRTTCLQMIGRAGRPQFDTEGVALVPRYQNLLQGAELVESQLKDSFPEYLNAEIALRTVTDVSVAISWLKGSFFYIRVRKNPAAYGISGNKLTESSVEKILKDQLILANVRELAKYGMVHTDEYGFALEPMVPGQLMARHYIRFKTMVAMCNTPSPAGLPELLMTIACSAEFSSIKLRRSEKKPLNAINKGSNVEGGKAHAVRFCVPDPHKPQKTKERISTGPEKIFIMVNEGLSDSPADLLDFSMKQELEQVLKVGERIALCMTKYFAHVGRLAATANSMLLHKALRHRMWDDSRHVARQLPGIGSLLADRLVAAGIDHLRKLQDTDPRRIETVTQRHYPFGNQVKEELRSRMPPPFSLAVLPLRRIAGGKLELEITLTRESTSSGSQSRTFAKLIAGSLHDDCLLLHESLVVEHFPSPYTVKFATRNPVPADVQAVRVVASVILDKLIGLDVTKVVTIPKTANLQCVGQKGQQASNAEQHDGTPHLPDQLRSQQHYGYSQTDTQHLESCPMPQASAAPSQQQVRKPVPSRPSGRSCPRVAPSVAPAEQPMGLQQKLAGQLQRSQVAAPSSTARSQQANRLHSAVAAGSNVGTIANAGREARALGPGREARALGPGASGTRNANGSDPESSTANEPGAANETSTEPSCPARTHPGTRADCGFGTGGAATRGPPLHGQTSNAGILPVGPAKGGTQRRKLVHTVCLQPDAPPSSGVQGQAAAGLPNLQPAGVHSLGNTHMPPDQTRGVSVSGVEGNPANLLLHDRQAQQQASGPQSTHHYHRDLLDSPQYQLQITELSGSHVDHMHSLPAFAGNSMGVGAMQKVSPQAISQTASFSRFNHSALLSSRKRSASQTPPDQQAEPGAGQGASAMFDVVRSKAKKLPGTTPGSNVSSSSIFGGGRLPSPAPGILCRSTTTSSGPGLLNRLSQNQIASRSLAAPTQNYRQPSWQGQQAQGYQQPLAEPLAQPSARSAIPKAHQPESDSSVRSVATAPVDWSSYLDDGNVSGSSEPAGRPDSKAPAFESVFSMREQPWRDGEQPANHSMTVPRLHRKSPMDAKLQPLIAGPSGEHATRLLQQQQLRGRIPPDEHDSKQLQQQLPRQDVYSDVHASRPLPQQQAQGDKPLRDAQASKPTGRFVSAGTTRTKAGRRLLVQPVPSATDLTECSLEPSRFMPSSTLRQGGTSNRMTTDPSLDKENAQQAGHRAPVRKVLFAGHSNCDRQVSARAISLPPTPSHCANGADKPGLRMPSADSQAAVAVKPETPVHNACTASVDFSSVFDFL